MAKMRSVLDAYQRLKVDDPDTAVTVCMLRRFLAEGRIPSIRVGRKILLNYDALLTYLTGTLTDPPGAQEEPPCTGEVRPVPADLK